jgi:hypothetical protein
MGYSQTKFKNKTEKYIRHIEIDKVLKPYFDDLVHFYREHNVFIDYTKIKGIRTNAGRMYSKEGRSLAGVVTDDNVIYIRIDHPVAVHHGVYNSIMLATLAHEIGHTQGLEHTGDDNPHNLMYGDNSPLYDNLIVYKKPISEILLSPYK